MTFDPVKSTRLITVLGLESLMMEYRARGDEDGFDRVAEYADGPWIELTDEERNWVNARSDLARKINELAIEMCGIANERNDDMSKVIVPKGKTQERIGVRSSTERQVSPDDVADALGAKALKALGEYRGLEKQLVDMREVHKGQEAPEEEDLLDKMTDVWYRLSKEDQDLIRGEKAKSLIASEDSGISKGHRKMKDGKLVEVDPQTGPEKVHVKSLNAVFHVDGIEKPPSRIFAMVKNSLGDDDGLPMVNISMEMYVHLGVLSDDLKARIREELESEVRT